MPTITSNTIDVPARRPTAFSLRLSTVLVGFAAAAIVTAAAAILRAAGVPFAIEDEVIPLGAFAQLTFLGAALGGLLLAVLDSRQHARRRFVAAAAVLAGLSCVPALLWPDDGGTKLALVALHVLAAAVVVPPLARHAHS